MSNINDRVTICGNVGNDPTLNTTTTGVPVLNFRVGSSSRHRDRQSGEWVDSGTNWYAVSAFRNLAEHAKASLRCGDPVIITGTLKLREYESNGRKGFSADLNADAIGHDLSLGTSAFARRHRAQAQPAHADADAGRDPRDAAPREPFAYDDEPPVRHSDAWAAAGLTDPSRGADDGREPLEDASVLT